nr:hypothetical protein [Tanacetum cinerariifolium]
MTKNAVIKIVLEEAKNIGLDPKTVTSAKGGEEFKKSQGAKMKVHQRDHSQKVNQVMELNKKRVEQYMWTVSIRLKPEPINNVKIHPNSKPAVLTIYKNNDKRNFRLKKILEELKIQSALPVVVPDQGLSKSSRRKRRHIELRPKIKVPGFEYYRSLPKGIPFVNNMVIKNLKIEICTCVFKDQAEVVVAQEEVQEKIYLVENEEELIEEEEFIKEEE